MNLNTVRVGLSQIYMRCFGRVTLIGDEAYNRILYWVRLGKRANVKAPQTFNEHILARKVYLDEYHLAKYTDKYEVRRYVEDVIGEQYLVPCYGVWNFMEEIPFQELPKQYVLKATHGSGWNVVVSDSTKSVSKKEYNRLKRALKSNYYYRSREKNYRDILPRIVCEKYLSPQNENGLIDFKIYCFDGKARFIHVTYERDGKEYSDMLYTDLRPVGLENAGIDHAVIPSNYTEIIGMAEKLAAQFPFVRVDFYLVDEDVKFSELTFHSGGGIRPFKPESVDLALGKFFDEIKEPM